MRNHRSVKSALIVASVVLAAAALWSCRNALKDTGKRAGDMLDARWLRQHPINYA